MCQFMVMEKQDVQICDKQPNMMLRHVNRNHIFLDEEDINEQLDRFWVIKESTDEQTNPEVILWTDFLEDTLNPITTKARKHISGDVAILKDVVFQQDALVFVYSKGFQSK